jgi:oligogalacturonide lyase
MIPLKTPFAGFLLILIFTCLSFSVFAQTVMETGGQKMPDEWIDKSTGHKIIRLTRMEGRQLQFLLS